MKMNMFFFPVGFVAEALLDVLKLISCSSPVLVLFAKFFPGRAGGEKSVGTSAALPPRRI